MRVKWGLHGEDVQIGQGFECTTLHGLPSAKSRVLLVPCKQYQQNSAAGDNFSKRDGVRQSVPPKSGHVNG
jgi:hypothetical protein